MELKKLLYFLAFICFNVLATAQTADCSAYSYINNTLIEAEDYCEESGTSFLVSNTVVGGFHDGDWLRYGNVNFDYYNTIGITINASLTSEYTGQIQVYLDGISGTYLGEVTTVTTTGTSDFSALYFEISEEITGTHDVYLVGVSEHTAKLANIGSFQFEVEACSTSNTFYIDSESGSDSNNGLTEATAWQSFTNINTFTFCPGDQILFKAGQSWTGTLQPKGSGEADNPIVIGSYGTGDAPILYGDSSVDCSVSSRVIYCTIGLYNQEYWTIQDLEIINFDASEEGDISLDEWEANNVTDYIDVEWAPHYTGINTKKCGILVEAEGVGEVNSLHFTGLEIHGVNGDITDKDNGGIYFEIYNEGDVATYFDDILIDDCYIHDVDRTGVSNNSVFSNRTLDVNTDWVPSTNFVVQNSIFERTGANSVIIRVADAPLIENCLFDNNSIKESGNAAFFFNTDDGIMQYNEFRYTKANEGDNDAGGPDADFRTKGSIIQYNYIHDNDYGMLVTGGSDPTSGRFNDGTIVRYNIFENDGLVARPDDGAHILKTSGNVTNCTFHNNVVYVGATQVDTKVIWNKTWGGAQADYTYYYNNIIYNLGTGTFNDFNRSTNNTIGYNLYYGNEVTFEDGMEAIETIKFEGDPLFTDPGNGEDGYQITSESPAYLTALVMDPNAETDYYGNPIDVSSSLNIGIHQFELCSDENDGYALIEAEDFCEMFGVTIYSTGTLIGGFHDADWLRYSNVDFGSDNPVYGEIYASLTTTNFGDIEVRLDSIDGTLLGSVTTVETSGNYDFATLGFNITETVTGVHDIYLVGSSSTPGSKLANIDSFLLYNETTLSTNTFTTTNDSVNVYPNPFNVSLSFSSNRSLSYSYTISGINGQLISLGTISGSQKLDTSMLSSGIYFVKLTNSLNESKVFKVIKE